MVNLLISMTNLILLFTSHNKHFTDFVNEVWGERIKLNECCVQDPTMATCGWANHHGFLLHPKPLLMITHTHTYMTYLEKKEVQELFSVD